MTSGERAAPNAAIHGQKIPSSWSAEGDEQQ